MWPFKKKKQLQEEVVRQPVLTDVNTLITVVLKNDSNDTIKVSSVNDFGLIWDIEEKNRRIAIRQRTDANDKDKWYCTHCLFGYSIVNTTWEIKKILK